MFECVCDACDVCDVCMCNFNVMYNDGIYSYSYCTNRTDRNWVLTMSNSSRYDSFFHAFFIFFFAQLLQCGNILCGAAVARQPRARASGGVQVLLWRHTASTTLISCCCSQHAWHSPCEQTFSFRYLKNTRFTHSPAMWMMCVYGVGFKWSVVQCSFHQTILMQFISQASSAQSTGTQQSDIERKETRKKKTVLSVCL